MTPKELLALWDKAVCVYRTVNPERARVGLMHYYWTDQELDALLEENGFQTPIMVAYGI